MIANMTYGRIMAFVEKHRLEMVQKLAVCVCGKVIYYDFKDPVLKERYSFSGTRRDVCPLCLETKNIPGTDRPRKLIYYISPMYWIQDLFLVPDLAANMRNDTDPCVFSPGALRRSEGYRAKVTDNPRMNSDSRHAPLIGMADGAPYFKDRHAGSGWFFILRHAALPEELLLDPSLAHLCLFISGDHYRTDPLTGVTKKTRGYVCITHTQHVQILECTFYLYILFYTTTP